MIHFPNAGLLSSFFDKDDPRPAAEQLNEAYAHGGGFQPFDGFSITNSSLVYPGDPPLREISRAKLRDETLILFECEWLAIVQADGSFAVTRVD